jgi:hypothetical protein
LRGLVLNFASTHQTENPLLLSLARVSLSEQSKKGFSEACPELVEG